MFGGFRIFVIKMEEVSVLRRFPKIPRFAGTGKSVCINLGEENKIKFF
jgi:hypothetical protein